MTRDDGSPRPYSLLIRDNDERLARANSFILRRLSAPLRSLPDFLIIGAMKAGTTSLFHYIKRHPAMRSPIRKEIHYFDIGRRKSVWWYRAHFPICLPPGSVITGEACPAYLFCPGADRRIHELLPDVRLIVLLRNPVERAISHYFHERRMGREHLPIMKALKVEERRLARLDLDDQADLDTYLHASYKCRGHYADQLARYHALFPADRILILASAQLFSEPRLVMARVFRFLGLEEFHASVYPRKNSGRRERVPDEVYRHLRSHFRPHDERLREMIRDLDGSWLDR